MVKFGADLVVLDLSDRVAYQLSAKNGIFKWKTMNLTLLNQRVECEVRTIPDHLVEENET